MSRAHRVYLAIVLLLGSAVSRAEDLALERGTAIMNPDLLRQLDARGMLEIGALLHAQNGARQLATDKLFASVPELSKIRPAIDAEFDRYIERHKSRAPNETIGVGEAFDVQLFDRSSLNSSATRFVLSGIVNRMDRAYVPGLPCGEIRVIYRLVRFEPDTTDDKSASRLPMTLNLILNASGDREPHASCGDIARRWLAFGKTAELATTFKDATVDRIETNLQLAVAPKSARHDFRTDYLLKVFRPDQVTGVFEESPLENQIDRDRILGEPALGREFRTWLLAPAHLAEFDRGTVLIPEKFLAGGAVAPTPAGLAPSELQPEFGLMEGEGSAGPGSSIFSEADVVDALKAASEHGIKLQNIRSVAGFQRRLNDITCAGCHQTRAVGGFHFPGVDWLSTKSSTIVPASPHFVGEQIRRRDILTAFAAGRQPDFSRGFADRPQLRGSSKLAGTEYRDGWGAHCYLQQAGSTQPDKSFLSWTCAKGLSCQPVSANARIGMCLVQTR